MNLDDKIKEYQNNKALIDSVEQKKKIIELLEKQCKTHVQLKFYADLSGKYHNKMFCFNCDTYEKATGIFNKFLESGNNIRALFLVGSHDIFYNGSSIGYNVQISRKNDCFTIPRFECLQNKIVVHPS